MCVSGRNGTGLVLRVPNASGYNDLFWRRNSWRRLASIQRRIGAGRRAQNYLMDGLLSE